MGEGGVGEGRKEERRVGWARRFFIGRLGGLSEEFDFGEVGGAHEELIDAAGGLTAFGDSPDDEGLTASHITCGEDGRDGGHVVFVGFDISAGVFFEAELIDGSVVFGAYEAHSEEAEVAAHFEVGAGDFGHGEAAIGGFGPIESGAVEFCEDAVVSVEFSGVDGVVADFGGFAFVFSLLEDDGLFVGGGGAEDHRPGRPGHIGGAFLWGFGEEFELGDGGGALSEGGAEAVGAGVAAAEDDDVFIFGVDELIGGYGVALVSAVLLGEVIHGEVDAFELSSRDVEVAGFGGAAAEDDGVEVTAEVVEFDIETDVGVGEEGDSFGLEEVDTAVDDLFFEFEIGDAVGEESADAVGAFEDGDGVPGLVELSGAGESGGSGADDGDFFAGA